MKRKGPACEARIGEERGFDDMIRTEGASDGQAGPAARIGSREPVQ